MLSCKRGSPPGWRIVTVCILYTEEENLFVKYHRIPPTNQRISFTVTVLHSIHADPVWLPSSVLSFCSPMTPAAHASPRGISKLFDKVLLIIISQLDMSLLLAHHSPALCCKVPPTSTFSGASSLLLTQRMFRLLLAGSNSIPAWESSPLAEEECAGEEQQTIAAFYSKAAEGPHPHRTFPLLFYLTV